MNAALIEQETNLAFVQDIPMESAYVQVERPFGLKVAFRESLSRFRQDDTVLVRTQGQDFVELRRLFVFDRVSEVESFLTDHPALPGLLLEAADQLGASFGRDVPLRLEAWMDDEDGSRSLRAVALWAGPAIEAVDALRQFDEAWWFRNCRRGSGNLILDYELI